MRFACWVTKAINIHSEYEILIAFLQQRWLFERASVLRYTYIPCLFVLCNIHIYAIKFLPYSSCFCFVKLVHYAMAITPVQPYVLSPKQLEYSESCRYKLVWSVLILITLILYLRPKFKFRPLAVLSKFAYRKSFINKTKYVFVKTCYSFCLKYLPNQLKCVCVCWTI
jgi:hypothetical protein